MTNISVCRFFRVSARFALNTYRAPLFDNQALMQRMSLQQLVLFVPTLQFPVNIEHNPQQQNWSDSSLAFKNILHADNRKVSSKLTMRLNFKVEPLIYPSASFTCNVGKISSRWTKVGYILLPFRISHI